mmetsp:Transcript_21171/g.33192  ORF Transcript_21171/g.33192 Transcript_21171/m.33192 type:complete len:101 (+) Transcript_21171:194-496(+)
MKPTFALVLFLHAAIAVLAALPPGYDEELYCPKGSCLMPKDQPPGFVGGRVSFHQCVDVSSKEHVASPMPWGNKIDQEVKDSFIAGGFHTTKCEDIKDEV